MSDDPTWAGIGRGLLDPGRALVGLGRLRLAHERDRPGRGLGAPGACSARWRRCSSPRSPCPHAFDDATPCSSGSPTSPCGPCTSCSSRRRRRNVDVRQAAFRLARTAIPGPALLVVAGFLDGPAQIALWIAALTIDYSGPYVFGVRGFSVSRRALRGALRARSSSSRSASRSSRSGSAPPASSSTRRSSSPPCSGSRLACALWWAYFDIVAHVARRKLVEAQGHARVRLARDSFSYLHLPMFAGIVLVALGMQEGARARGRAARDGARLRPLRRRGPLPALSHDAIRYRNVRSVNPADRCRAARASALIPLALEVDALAALAAVAAVAATFVAYEAIRFRENRAALRATA